MHVKRVKPLELSTLHASIHITQQHLEMSMSGIDSSLSGNGEGGALQSSPHILTFNSYRIVNLATRIPPTSSTLPTSSPGGAPAVGPRVVRGFTWHGGGPALANEEARKP